MPRNIEIKNIDKSDERREFPNGHLAVNQIGDVMFGRAVFQPGWRWSESVKPIAGTDSCQARHNGYIQSGQLHIRMDDGYEADLGPGDFFVCEPGHDAWVLGEEPCVAYDFSSDVQRYAVPPT
jgi:hypothetical protein